MQVRATAPLETRPVPCRYRMLSFCCTGVRPGSPTAIFAIGVIGRSGERRLSELHRLIREYSKWRDAAIRFESTELPLRIGGNVLMATADNADPPRITAVPGQRSGQPC